MFLFLSKLLPLLVYPLGLSCVLILGAIVLLPQKVRQGTQLRRPKLLLSLAVGLLWLSSTPFCANHLLGSLERQYQAYGSLEALPQADAIVILGGATRSANQTRPYAELGEAGNRLVHGVRLYRAGKAPRLILSGGHIDWTGNNTGTSEAADMANLLDFWLIPQEALILETQSLNTYQNAINTQALLTQHQLGSVLLVTSAFHMPRAIAIFQKLGIETIAAPTDFRVSLKSFSVQQLLLDLLPDAYHLRDTSLALKEYLGLMVYRLKGWL